MTKIIAVTGLGYAFFGLLAEGAENKLPILDGYLQYGALGLCAVMVLLNYRDRWETVKQLKSQEERNVLLLQRNIRAFERISQALEDRPCLHGDQRIKTKHNDGDEE